METKARRSARQAPPVEMPAVSGAGEAANVEGGAPIPAPAETAKPPAPPARAALAAADPLSALMESQAAVARGLEALSDEMAGLARSGIAAAARTASAMLSAKTLFDAIEVNAGFARNGFDALVAGSAKLSEIGLRTAAEASRPILAQLDYGRKPAR